jgi:uncharacterized membrane protein
MRFMFSLSQFAITAGIMAVLSLLLLFGARPFFKIGSPVEIILIALVAGFSVLAFRASANTTVLNADPIPAISPNDILCPVMTYVFLSVYGAFRYPRYDIGFEQAKATLTLVSFAVNVITI